MSEENQMFWEMSDEDGFFGEDEEAYVSENDPLHTEGEDPFSPFERYQDPASIATVGAMCETKKESTIFVDDNKVVEYVSMRDHLRSKNTKAGDGKKPPLRPFEQWLKDVREGKKTIDDPL